MKNARALELRCIARLVILAATLLSFATPSIAQVNVLISGGFSTAYKQLLPEFEKTTGITVTTGSGASQGTGQQTLGKQDEATRKTGRTLRHGGASRVEPVRCALPRSAPRGRPST